MPTDDPTHRSLHTHQPAEVTVREADDVEGDDGMMEIRLPIASTGDVRNEGDDPLSGAELRGMAQQVDSLTRGVFLEHGMSNSVDRETYSQLGKLGYWASADLKRDASEDDEDLLVATARIPDPETLPASTGDYREALAILKEQALRGIPIAASIGWRDDDSAPGGVDLMEASIVGIGADPRTQTEGGEQLVARAAVAAGADPDDLVQEVREIVADVRADTPDDARPLGPPGDRDRFEDFDECVATLSEDDDVSREDAEQICGAWENASSADDPEDTHDMTDDDTPGEGTTEEEQTADDGDTEQRAPEDVTEDDLLTFTAMHFDGMDEGDLAEAVDAADAEYIGECDAEALYDFVSIVTGAEYGAVEDAMGDLMTEEQGDYGDEGEEDEEDEDDEEMSADDPDAEQSADTDGGEQRATDELDDRLSDIEDTLADIRAGEIDIATPDTPDDGEDEQRDTTDDTDTDPAAKPAWATED